MGIVEKVRTGVYKICSHPNNELGMDIWTHHIDTVFRIVRENHGLYGADLEVTTLAALLHDIASIKDKSVEKEHVIESARLANGVLSRFEYDKEKIALVEKCILNHHKHLTMGECTPEEVCVSDADALANIFEVPFFLKKAYGDEALGVDEGAKKVHDMIEENYSRLSNVGKVLGFERYKAAQKTLTRNDYK